VQHALGRDLDEVARDLRMRFFSFALRACQPLPPSRSSSTPACSEP
jgi:hypothetical protein